jgi:ubiquinone/menaquinone biosynthesis C-methylase UbiE
MSEQYTIGYGEAADRWMRQRSAASDAGFFLPQLRPGARVLDVGCGPGSITVGLAEAAAPGQVIGVDVEPVQIQRARALAAERALDNVRFEVASAYKLPYPDASFDAVFAHFLLGNLHEPLRAMCEMRRVLGPGGVAGILDTDWGCWILEPSTELLRSFQDVLTRAIERCGASPYYARHQRRLLLEAGFSRAEAYARAGHQGTPERTRMAAENLEARLRAPLVWNRILAEGWADLATLEAMCAELHRWAEQPDAFQVALRCFALAWARRERASRPRQV